MKRYSRPQTVVTDRLPSYGATMQAIDTDHRSNNRAENSCQPFRRRERSMLRFRRMRTLQKFAVVHGSIYNHFNQERHLSSRQTYKANRSAALAD